jgi:parvulin-like peptidyl-prolyl isomerase
VADERDRIADERDRIANEREDLANQRERAADEREGSTEGRERERVRRVQESERRERDAARREEAVVEREIAVTELELAKETAAEPDPAPQSPRAEDSPPALGLGHGAILPASQGHRAPERPPECRTRQRRRVEERRIDLANRSTDPIERRPSAVEATHA